MDETVVRDGKSYQWFTFIGEQEKHGQSAKLLYAFLP